MGAVILIGVIADQILTSRKSQNSRMA